MELHNAYSASKRKMPPDHGRCPKKVREYAFTQSKAGRGRAVVAAMHVFGLSASCPGTLPKIGRLETDPVCTFHRLAKQNQYLRTPAVISFTTTFSKL